MKIIDNTKKYINRVDYEDLTYRREETFLKDGFETGHWVQWEKWRGSYWSFLNNDKLEKELEKEFQKIRNKELRKEKLTKIEND